MFPSFLFDSILYIYILRFQLILCLTNNTVICVFFTFCPLLYYDFNC